MHINIGDYCKLELIISNRVKDIFYVITQIKVKDAQGLGQLSSKYKY